jgi:hypothetical protein
MKLAKLFCRFCSQPVRELRRQVTQGIPMKDGVVPEVNTDWAMCDCGFVSQFPYSNDQEQAKFYGDFEIMDWDGEEFRAWHNWESLLKSCEYNAHIMDADRDRYPRRRYLEVAAFSGFLMEHMRGRGWNVRGQELTKHGCAEAARHGLKVDCCSVFDYEPGQEFDVISVREFIEHVWDYRGVLQRCFSWQAKGGALWIQTPVTDEGLDFKRRIAFQPDHVSLFSLANLRDVLLEVGYEPVLLENRDGCGIVKAIKRTCPA